MRGRCRAPEAFPAMKRSHVLAGAVSTVLATAPFHAGPACADPADPHAGKLEEVVVTATPFERSPLQIAQPTIVLSGEALHRDLGASIGETVSRQLGVT